MHSAAEGALCNFGFDSFKRCSCLRHLQLSRHRVTVQIKTADMITAGSGVVGALMVWHLRHGRKYERTLGGCWRGWYGPRPVPGFITVGADRRWGLSFMHEQTSHNAIQRHGLVCIPKRRILAGVSPEQALDEPETR